MNKKAYEHIEAWRIRPLSGIYPYVYLDGIFLERNWGGEIENVSVFGALAVNADGYREIIGACEGAKEDTELAGILEIPETALPGWDTAVCGR